MTPSQMNEGEQLAAKALIADIFAILSDVPSSNLIKYEVRRWGLLEQTDRRVTVEFKDGSTLSLSFEKRDVKPSPA